MRKVFAGCALIVCALAVAAVAAAGVSKETFPLYHGFNIGAACDGSGVELSPGTVIDPAWSVTFQVKKDTISATIETTQAFPADQAVYVVRLIQGPEDCQSEFVEVDFRKEKGKATISEPVKSDFAFVHIDVREVPCCIVDSSLVSETFRH